MLGFVLGHKSPRSRIIARRLWFLKRVPRFSVWTADELFWAEEFAIASAAAKLNGPQHRYKHSPLISINPKSRFGELTWEAARAHHANPSPWVVLKHLAFRLKVAPATGLCANTNKLPNV
jgi:hypothetical protein